MTFVAGVPPNVTVAPVWNPVPVMVTGVEPVVGPDVGKIDVTVGAAKVTVKPLNGRDPTPAAEFSVTVRSVRAAAGVTVTVMATLVAVALPTVAVTPVPLNVTPVVFSKPVPLIVAGSVVPRAPTFGVMLVMTPQLGLLMCSTMLPIAVE